MKITFRSDIVPEVGQIIELYNATEMPRPTKDENRMRIMFQNSDLVITAWDCDKLVGICRSITDWVWCCYLSDLAVNPDSKKRGIGRTLIEKTKEMVGDQSMILLLSVPTAMEYYPKVGFQKENRGFIINRTK